MNWNVEDEIFGPIAQRSRGIPRLALRLLEATKRTARVKLPQLSLWNTFMKTCELEGIDELGLGPDERKYLTILAEHQYPYV